MLGLWSGLYKLMLNKSTGHWELLHGNNVPNACTTLGRGLKRGNIKVKKSEDDSCFSYLFIQGHWIISVRAGKEERSFKLPISAHLSPPSLHPQSVLYPMSSSPLTVAVRLMPPLSFFLKPMLGGLLFKRIPKPSNSFSIIFLCPKGFRTSRTIKIKLHVRATGGKNDTLSLMHTAFTNPKTQIKVFSI